MPLFETHLVVDWSANSIRLPAAPTRNGIWWAANRKGEALEPEYSRTRREALNHIAEFIASELDAGRRVLAGFDFPFGYPEGVAERLCGQSCALSLWEWLAERIRDDRNNANNRFEVAEGMNREWPGVGPFWGKHPQWPAEKFNDIPHRKNDRTCRDQHPKELRLADHRAEGAQSPWQLFGNGAVGSQVLVGLPALLQLLNDQRIPTRGSVWPFETKLSAPATREAALVLAEVYPSLLRDVYRELQTRGEILDRAQVRFSAEAFARLDRSDRLTPLFKGPPDLSCEQRTTIETEEGWVLGLGHEEALHNAVMNPRRSKGSYAADHELSMSNIIPEIQVIEADLVAWRQDFHAHPELAYEERRTSGLVAERMRSWGITVDCGLAQTGVVGTLTRGDGATIGLRADMDALPMEETNTFAHRSQNPGRMHACGHDGHTTMLLGAARYLAEHGDFSGTVRFIFQPAEEAAGGAKRMLDEGLFSRFPVDAVFGMHNWPGLPAGQFAIRSGPMMASLDTFDIRIAGHGAHGAAPQDGVDPVAAAAQVVTAVQTIVSRNIDPQQSAVISVTRIHGGDADNVIPPEVRLGGGIRSFDPEVRALLCGRLEEVVEGVCASLGASGTVNFTARYPAVINTAESATLAARTAAGIVGEDNLDADADPVMVSEDFAYLLEASTGCFMLIGNGPGEGGCAIHNPGYDFNDDILSLGATYWARLAESFLRKHS